MRNRPPNLSTVGGVDRQTDISNERLRTISCIGVKQIPQKYRRLVMGSLGSHKKKPVLTHRPSNKLIPCWLTTTARLRIRQPQCKFLPRGGGANTLQQPTKYVTKTSPNHTNPTTTNNTPTKHPKKPLHKQPKPLNQTTKTTDKQYIC